MVNRFILNEVSYFGPGARKKLPEEIKRLGLKKALVVSDASLVKFGVTGKVTAVLDEAGVPYEIFSDIKPNPTVTNVKNGVAAFAASGADFIVAVGGGSSMDTAKAVGIITNNPEFADVVSLEGVANTKHKSVPIIALPTTAGTAAETTINYVITDEVKEKKMVCVDPNDIPAIAIIDAELMYSLPKSLTASTGLDALTHAIEGLTTKAAWEMSDMFEIKAIDMINRYLELAVNEPTNPVGRDGMAVAQYIAGMAFSNVGLGLVHGMAHPLGAMFDVPHGVANALLLPLVMEYNAPAALDKFVIIAQTMNVYKEGMTKEEAADAAVKAVRDLAIRVGIPQHLRDLGKGITEADLPRLAKAAMEDVCTPGNPRDVTEDIVLELYKKAFW
jgi:lactaldehyde reductase